MSKRKIVSRLLPETRSVRRLRELGYVADMAEIRKGKFIKSDWGGFADMFAVRNFVQGNGLVWGIPDVLFVQATGWGDVRTRERKVLRCPDAYDVVYAGCRVQVWGWDQRREEPKVIDLSDLSLYDPLPYGHPDRL